MARGSARGAVRGAASSARRSGIPRDAVLGTRRRDDPWIDPADVDRLGDPLAWGIPADAGVSMRETKDATLYSIVVSDPMRDVVLFGSFDGSFGLYFEPGLLVLPPGIDRS